MCPSPPQEPGTRNYSNCQQIIFNVSMQCISLQPLTILTNMLGFSIPIPLCISTSLQAQHIALLGYIPPILMLATVTGYVIRWDQSLSSVNIIWSEWSYSVRFVKMLSNRSSLNGITLLSLLIYKYIADTSFTLISCTNTSNGWVSHLAVLVESCHNRVSFAGFYVQWIHNVLKSRDGLFCGCRYNTGCILCWTCPTWSGLYLCQETNSELSQLHNS